MKLLLVRARCSELAEPIAATCTKAHGAKLYRWRVDGNLCKFYRLVVMNPVSRVKRLEYLTFDLTNYNYFHASRVTV